MGEKNQMNKVYFFKDSEKLADALKKMNIDHFSDKEVLVKIHMGELKNKYFPRPDFVKQVISELQNINAHPFLYDTTVLYNSLRKQVSGYEKVAKIHGFSQKKIGCPVKIDDSGIEVTIEDHIFEVGTMMHNTEYVFAISHVKGHVASGMGGTIKNFGMGGVTRNSKKMMHHGARPQLQSDSCTYCGYCAKVCPFHAITVKEKKWKWNKRSCFGCGVCVENCPSKALEYQIGNFQYLLACAAKACLKGKQAIYLNDVNRISKSCDCDPFADPIICPDIGYLVSFDPVAVEKASLDLIDSVKHDVFLNENHIDPFQQVRFGELIGLGSSTYELIRI